jgi:hypothetical protein
VFSDPQIKWVVQKLGVKRIGGLFPNDESGQQVGAANEAAYEAAAQSSSPRNSSSGSGWILCRY